MYEYAVYMCIYYILLLLYVSGIQFVATMMGFDIYVFGSYLQQSVHNK